MLGDAVLYAASRATSAAVDNASRRVAWAATASGFLLCALVSALIVAYWLIEPRVGTLNAVAFISAACAAAGIVCLSLPRLIDGVKQRRSRNRSPVVTTVAVVNDEAKEAVDYFGALQVVGAAFVFGLGAARKLKR
jgi:hypothetical protein